MILMIMFLIMANAGFVILKLYMERDNIPESLVTIGATLTVFGGAPLIVSVMFISLNNCTANLEIQKNRIEYEGLCKRLEIINSDYEDLSKSDVIADITEWNTKVYKTKYWSYNPWTSWFNPRIIADDLNYISLNGEDGE